MLPHPKLQLSIPRRLLLLTIIPVVGLIVAGSLEQSVAKMDALLGGDHSRRQIGDDLEDPAAPPDEPTEFEPAPKDESESIQRR